MNVTHDQAREALIDMGSNSNRTVINALNTLIQYINQQERVDIPVSLPVIIPGIKPNRAKTKKIKK